MHEKARMEEHGIRLTSSGCEKTDSFICHYSTTTMEDVEIWCLLIDHDHKSTFGEPFPVSISHGDTIHKLKIKIWGAPNSPDLVVTTNSIEIWKCKSYLPRTPSITRKRNSAISGTAAAGRVTPSTLAWLRRLWNFTSKTTSYCSRSYPATVCGVYSSAPGSLLSFPYPTQLSLISCSMWETHCARALRP